MPFSAGMDAVIFSDFSLPVQCHGTGIKPAKTCDMPRQE